MEAPPLRSDTRDARVLLQANGACHLSDELFYHAELTCSVVNHLELVETIATATTLEWKFSDGRTVSYPRDPIDIGNLTFSYTQTANGKYFYKYTLDNRLVQMIRIGEFDHDLLGGILHRGAQPILRGPDGWTDLGIGWLPSREDPVTRCETAKYTILSNFLPGPLPLHVAGAEKVRDDFQLPFKGRNSWERHLIQQIDITIRQYGTSADPLVIGPAFTPNPTENEVRDRIHRLVELDGFDFLRPLDDATVNLVETQCAVVPGTDFELQILDCLKVAIRAMILDNPAAPQIERARAGRKARSRLSARGVTTLEQAQIRLRSLRAAQSILNIVNLKTSVARAPGHTSYVQMEEEQDARLEAITKSKMFATTWKTLAERLSVDEPYHTKLSLGLNAALKRLSTRIETLHLAYDLKVSTEFCQAEVVRACTANLAKIQAESVVGIHLSEEEAKASLSAENWQLIDTASYGPDIRRRFTCQAGNHQLRADVWTDFVDEKIEGISLQLVVQVVVRYQDGSEQPRMLDGNLVTLMLDQEWKLGESLLRFPSM